MEELKSLEKYEKLKSLEKYEKLKKYQKLKLKKLKKYSHQSIQGLFPDSNEIRRIFRTNSQQQTPG